MKILYIDMDNSLNRAGFLETKSLLKRPGFLTCCYSKGFQLSESAATVEALKASHTKMQY